MVYQRAVSLFLCRKYRSDISGITTKAPCEAALMGERHVRIEICISLCALLCFCPLFLSHSYHAAVCRRINWYRTFGNGR